MLGGAYIIAPLIGVKAGTGIFITHTAVTAIFSALGVRQLYKAESGREKAAIAIAIIIMFAFWGYSVYHFTRAAIPLRLSQDQAVDPTPPNVKPLNRPISKSITQNARLQKDIATLKQMGARAMRVNQEQVNVKGVRVGRNKPDFQFTLNEKRFYIEYESSTSTRGPIHSARIQANDPKGIPIIIEQD